jgi:hypothetical protein
MLSTLGLVGAETQAVSPDPQLQQALASTIRGLNARRSRGAKDLRAKRTPAGQASAASGCAARTTRPHEPSSTPLHRRWRCPAGMPS